MSFDENQYKELYSLFDRECKRVEVYKSRELTKSTLKKEEYKKGLVETYNKLLIYLTPFANTDDKVAIQNRAVSQFNRLKECFQLLRLEYPFETTRFTTIGIDKITEARDPNPQSNGSDSDSSTSSTATVVDKHTDQANGLDNLEPNKTIGQPDALENLDGDKTPRQEHQSPTRSRTNSSSSEDSLEMAQTAKNLMQLATSTINYKFDGDPMKLDSFLDAIDLLSELCEPQNDAILLKFLMTRLEGKAREAMIKKPENLNEIITQLKAAVKTESSKVIEGRMLALRADKTNLTKFAERGEELAEQYRRSLINEGFPKEKAKEFAIEKTVELCRKSARSPTVVSIIASTKFSEPKEVIAKMIVEINNLKQLRSSSQYTHKNDNQKTAIRTINFTNTTTEIRIQIPTAIVTVIATAIADKTVAMAMADKISKVRAIGMAKTAINLVRTQTLTTDVQMIHSKFV